MPTDRPIRFQFWPPVENVGKQEPLVEADFSSIEPKINASMRDSIMGLHPAATGRRTIPEVMSRAAIMSEFLNCFLERMKNESE